MGQTPECSVKVTRQMEQAQPPSCKSAQSLSWAGWGADGGGCILPHPRPHLSIWWELVQNQSSSHLGLINNVLAENLLLLLLEASPAPPKEPVTCIRLGIHATQSGEDGSPPSRLECPHVSSLPRKQGHLSPEPSHRPSHSPRSPQRKSSILEV